MEEEIKLVITPPDRNTPGHIKRLREVTRLQFLMNRLQAQLQKDPLSVEFEQFEAVLDQSIGLLLQYVQEPRDPTLARELLENASQEEWETLFGAVKGSAENAPKEGNSGDS